MEKFRKLIGRIPTGVLSGLTLGVILWLTLAPHPSGDLEIPLFPGADKVIHALMFAILTWVVLLETMKHLGWKPVSLPAIGVVAIISGLIGIGVEILQRTMGLGRTFEINDILADTAGAMGAAGLWAMLQTRLVPPDK